MRAIDLTCISIMAFSPSSLIRNRQSFSEFMNRFSVSTAGHAVSRMIAKLLSLSGFPSSKSPRIGNLSPRMFLAVSQNTRAYSSDFVSPGEV